MKREALKMLGALLCIAAMVAFNLLAVMAAARFASVNDTPHTVSP